MKARLLLVLLLAAANVGYFAWSRDWLRPWGFAHTGPGEPQRLAQQIRPEALRMLGTGGDNDGNHGGGVEPAPAPGPAGSATPVANPPAEAEVPQPAASAASAAP